jgi:hypothetical protein
MKQEVYLVSKYQDNFKQMRYLKVKYREYSLVLT